MNVHVFTEIVNCGKIGRIALQSYCKHHNHIAHAYGTKEDFKDIEKNDKIVLCEVTDNEILSAYKKDHGGLPKLWAKIIQESKADTVIHFDSDVLFRAPLIEETIELSKTYDLIGPRRNQKKYCESNNFPYRSDTIATSLWCINTNKLSKWPYNILSGMCATHCPFEVDGRRQMLDYFDPVSYDIMRNGGKMYQFNYNEVGAVDENYSRENEFAYLNRSGVDFGSKVVHFAGVGSGMDAYLNRAEHTEGYKEFAIQRYALFCKIFYNEDLGINLDEFQNILDNKELFLQEMV